MLLVGAAPQAIGCIEMFVQDNALLLAQLCHNGKLPSALAVAAAAAAAGDVDTAQRPPVVVPL
jgi:hypothetical protein